MKSMDKILLHFSASVFFYIFQCSGDKGRLGQLRGIKCREDSYLVNSTMDKLPAVYSHNGMLCTIRAEKSSLKKKKKTDLLPLRKIVVKA